MSLYRGMDRAALDAAYNNGRAVATSPLILGDWRARSAAFRAARPQHLDLRYGPAERNRLDFFSAGAADAATLVFIHGGYWQRNAKEDFAFLAAGPLAHGINVALPGYTLAPTARLDDIVGEIRASLATIADPLTRLGTNPARIYVAGWSAGGHLAASMMTEPAVAGGLAISGIFDLEPIRLCYLNDKLALDEAEARRNSPLLQLPERAPRLLIAVGGGELPELRRQSSEYASAWAEAGLDVGFVELGNHNHFTILEELAAPDGKLTNLVCDLVAGR
ncbi:MAG TPA: alpha/beta hydrolase [Stellaceae bacterium]|nr:alpha/beta hydrolase [Stellaceae bacterium]